METRGQSSGQQEPIEGDALRPKVCSDTSDGHHTFKELYEHRFALFVALMKSHREIAWCSQKHSDGSMFDGWFIAGMDLPTGAVTYHLPLEWFSELDDIAILENAPEWDGYTPQDVVTRLVAWEPCGGSLVEVKNESSN